MNRNIGLLILMLIFGIPVSAQIGEHPVLLMGWSVNAWSFACKTANGTAIPIGGGSANVYVNLAPAVNVGQNLVVDLSTQIFCHNDYPETITDYVTLQRGSAYGGVLSNFSGTVKYSGSSYPFPTTSETPRAVKQQEQHNRHRDHQRSDLQAQPVL